MPWSRIPPEEEQAGLGGAPEGCDRTLSYAEAIREALDQAMEIDPKVFVMGQGVDDPTGMFGTTRGLHEKYGRERAFDTPLAENAMTGVAVGAALGGMRPVHFHNRPDFLLLAMDQLVNHASKWHYTYGGAVNCPLVVWACIGRSWGPGPQHSQALQGLFMHVPGLKLVMPSTAYDAKGLLLAAIADPNPVLIIEHRLNFRYKGLVPEKVYRLPLGKGVIRRPGKDVTIAGASYIITEAFEAAGELAKEGIEAEVVDLRTLRPLDESIMLESVAKTRRLVVVDTGWKTCGAAAGIAAVAAQRAVGDLEAPVRLVTCPDVPTPTAYTLEAAFYPGPGEIAAAARELVNWR